MKRIKLILLLILAIVFAIAVVALVACDNGNNPSTPTEKDITGITFDSFAVDYDGQEHEITVNGTLPEGTSVSYVGNKGTNSGAYNATATISGKGYKTLTLNATLTINKLNYDMSSVSWNYLQPFTYDGEAKSVTLEGALPSGVTVKAYTDNVKTDTGIYTAKVTFNYDETNHNAPTVADCIWNINGAPITGVTFEDLTVDYDGQEHEITVNGTLPQGANVAYESNKGTNAGTYNATATVTCTGYNTLTLNATLTVNKADITAELTLSNSTVEYDSLPHSIQIVGNVPAGITVTYFYNDRQVNSVTDVGDYTVRCELRGANYNDKTLTATLKIKSTEEQLYSAVTENGKIYFQNNLDGNKLYTVNGSGVSKVSNDVPNYMITNGNSLYYYSTSLFSKVIKSYDGSTVSPLYSSKGEYLTTDGTNIYYAINNLFVNTDQSGIYKYALDGAMEEPVRLTADKAEYLTYSNGYIYYSNKTDGGKLYRVSVNASNAQGEQLRGDKKDEKVSYVITDGENLYFNSTKKAAGVVGIAAAVTKYNIASGNEVKLTTDSGKYLTKVGSYVYYVNNDKITSELFGDGIYKVSALATADNNLSGTKVLSSDNNGYSSLTSDGTNLYYYKLNDKHFYRNSAEGDNEVDLMATFQPTDDTTLTGYSKLAEYNGEIYFTNPLDNGCLYKYNPTTRAKFKVLADSVSDVSFYTYNGTSYMYYSTYIATNYALFRMDLSTGETEKVTSHRVENLIFENDKIYCTRVVGLGSNYIMQMDLNGDNEVEVFKGASLNAYGLEKRGDAFYFGLDPATFGYKNVCVYTIGDNDKTDLHRASTFVVVGDKIYFFAHATDHNSSDNKEANALKVCNLDGSNTITLQRNVDITYMYATNGKVYFSSKSSQNSGLFVYDIEQNSVAKISDKPACGMTVFEEKVYFIQSEVTYATNNYYPTQNSSCDGRLYCYDGTNVIKVA